jgi:hypothetical protein
MEATLKISSTNHKRYNTSLIPDNHKVEQTSTVKKAYNLDIRSEALDKYYEDLIQNPYKVGKLSHWDIDGMIQVQGIHFNKNQYSKYLKVLL